MPDNDQFSIPIGEDDFAEKISFANEHQLGVEIAAFATGPGVHDAAARTRMQRALAAGLRGFRGRRSFHGAFVDLSVHSADPAIAAVARERIQRDLETAARLECQTVVFHTGFNPLIPVRHYEQEFLERHAAFWPRMAEEWPGLQIGLENLWEPAPLLLERLLRAIHHPRVELCLDVGHAHVYSDFSVETWLDRLRARITHMHWNDNHGDADSHLTIGEGNLPWKKIMALKRTLSERITVVLELKTLSAVRHSLRYLEGLQPSRARVLPGNGHRVARPKPGWASRES